MLEIQESDSIEACLDSQCTPEPSVHQRQRCCNNHSNWYPHTISADAGPYVQLNSHSQAKLSGNSMTQAGEHRNLPISGPSTFDSSFSNFVPIATGYDRTGLDNGSNFLHSPALVETSSYQSSVQLQSDLLPLGAIDHLGNSHLVIPHEQGYSISDLTLPLPVPIARSLSDPHKRPEQPFKRQVMDDNLLTDASLAWREGLDHGVNGHLPDIIPSNVQADSARMNAQNTRPTSFQLPPGPATSTQRNDVLNSFSNVPPLPLPRDTAANSQPTAKPRPSGVITPPACPVEPSCNGPAHPSRSPPPLSPRTAYRSGPKSPRSKATVLPDKDTFLACHICAVGRKFGDECAICLERPKKPVQLPCSHIYCNLCIRKWFKRSNTCPLDRRQLFRWTGPKVEFDVRFRGQRGSAT
ncbi:hypothetical protein CERZMDRAFT_82810 [Cercospora zeae-maydis SCOH1-5]|uniref:RING-type domain-containing protein n=1 Tax=Cercospora zeae-maydis SCOH1-5 TaxID=717836 RepID=A0A6A6FNE4_9PEZI|nr:hypothetical protein CERZMDRAFT_82810 [Cercospora zeae-maydis SCOH1-5]